MLMGTVIVVIGFLAGGLGLRMMMLMTARFSSPLQRGQGLQVIDQVPDILLADDPAPARHRALAGPDLVMVVPVSMVACHFPQVGGIGFQALATHRVAIGIVPMTVNAIVLEQSLSAGNGFASSGHWIRTFLFFFGCLPGMCAVVMLLTVRVLRVIMLAMVWLRLGMFMLAMVMPGRTRCRLRCQRQDH